jgi:Family of unknown function (DUF6130)
MSITANLAIGVLSIGFMAFAAAVQSAKDVKGATALVAIPNEPPAKLVVDPPVSEQLALGRVFIQYRTENLRILPVFGNAALGVSPRVGHLPYYVDVLLTYPDSGHGSLFQFHESFTRQAAAFLPSDSPFAPY